MKEVAYTQTERDELGRRMQLFAMEAVADLAIKAAQKRIEDGEPDKPIELDGNIDGVDYYVWLGPEGSRGEDLVLIEGLEE